MYVISQQWRQAAIDGILTILIDSVDKMNEPLWRTMTHAINKILVGVEQYPYGLPCTIDLHVVYQPVFQSAAFCLRPRQVHRNKSYAPAFFFMRCTNTAL